MVEQYSEKLNQAKMFLEQNQEETKTGLSSLLQSIKDIPNIFAGDKQEEKDNIEDSDYYKYAKLYLSDGENETETNDKEDGPGISEMLSLNGLRKSLSLDKIGNSTKLLLLKLKLEVTNSDFFEKFEKELEDIKEGKVSVVNDQETKKNIQYKETKNLEKAKEIYSSLDGDKPSQESFIPAYLGYLKLQDDGKIKNNKYLTIADFSKSNDDKRLYVINIEDNIVEYYTKVGHGKNSGGDYAEDFSNQAGSNKSSLGFMVASENMESNNNNTRNGLRLTGLEEGINDQSDERGIFIHPGGVESSEGCLTIPRDYDFETILEKIKGSLIYSYNEDYLVESNSLISSEIDLIDSESENIA